MIKCFITAICSIILTSGLSFAAESPTVTPTWAAYSGDAAWSEFTSYQLLVFSPTKHPQLRPLKGWGKSVYARFLFSSEAQKNILQHDTYSLSEVENPAVIRRIIERDIPTIVRKGFDGILLDMDHRGKDLELAGKITMLMNLLTEHYPYLRVMISVSYAHLSDELSSADDVLVHFTAESPDLLVENMPSTIEKIKKFSQDHQEKGVYVMILGDAPSPTACDAFTKANISCFSTDYQWSSLPVREKSP